MYKLFTTKRHGSNQDDEPVYIIRDGKFFRTVFHPAGYSDVPEYELGEDGKIYRTIHHLLGENAEPDYLIESDGVYRSSGHPENADFGFPDFVLVDH